MEKPLHITTRDQTADTVLDAFLSAEFNAGRRPPVGTSSPVPRVDLRANSARGGARPLSHDVFFARAVAEK